MDLDFNEIEETVEENTPEPCKETMAASFGKKISAKICIKEPEPEKEKILEYESDEYDEEETAVAKNNNTKKYGKQQKNQEKRIDLTE